jgi:DNA mismatch repair protein MutL
MYNPSIMSEAARIRILPESVASAIAAGEVIERPVSVVKELVENALDAEAARIHIEIEDAGSSRMVVSDDGIGIRDEDLTLAVERYATSKLTRTEDLFNIRTLGFRGEALSSIGAVSRLEIATRFLHESTGACLRIEAGKILEKGSIGTAPGTTITVRDLFFNVPARRKFLKSAVTERRRISILINRYALAYPRVAFRLMQEGRVSFESSGNGDVRELLSKVFNLEIAREMLALPSPDGIDYKIQGFVSPPHINRSNRQELIFFVNGRWVQDAGLAAAVLQAYHSLLMVGRFPITVLFLAIPADQVDVNVHPTKSEVRFLESQKVFSLLQRAVRATLLGQTAIPHLDFHSQWQSHGGSRLPGTDISPDWQFAGELGSEQSLIPIGIQLPRDEEQVPLLRSVGQVGRAYLVAEGPDGIYLVDQHAAHERILFEQYMHELAADQLESQGLLETITLELPSAQASILRENIEPLNALGFSLEEFGGHSFRLRSIPAMLGGKDPLEAIRSVVEDFEEDETPLASQREARLAARICKRLAIKSGQLLSLEEQRELIRSLERCASPRTCPHGRPTMIHLSITTLSRQFGRT